MEEAGIFQDLAFTVSLTVIVYFILSKLLSGFAEDVSNASNSRTDGFMDKAVFLEHIGEKYPGILDLGKERKHGISGLEVIVSGEVDDVDHESKELKEEKIDKGNYNNQVGGGVADEVLVQELVGGGEDIKEKVVDECFEIRQESPVEETSVALSLSEEFEVREGRNEGICEVLEDEDSKGTERETVQSTENREGNNDQEGKDQSEEGLFDDWEGIERTDLEKRFDAAVAFVGSKSNADRIDSNLRMKFYGLHRIAMEGPCHGPQPMALKVSARAKWNAWKKLGTMSSDMAMEQYMALLSKNIPGWEEKQ